MQFVCKIRMILAALVMVATASITSAADPAPTTITVKGMHCPMCAKKITKQLKEIKGIKDVKADVEAEKLTVLTTTAKAPTARVMWEAVQKAGYEPVKIEGPGGTFKEKPKA